MKKIIEELENAKTFLIYGAANNAKDAIFTLDTLYEGKIAGIVVSNVKKEERLYEFIVHEIDYFDDKINKEDAVVIVAMRPEYFGEVADVLMKHDYTRFYLYGDNNALMKEMNKRVYELGKKMNLTKEELVNLWNCRWMKRAVENILKEI